MKKFIDKRLFIVNTILMLLGILFGAVFIFFLDKLDKTLIANEIEEYFTIISNSKVSLLLFFNCFKSNILFIIFIFGCSILYLFSPLVLFISYYKGMLLGFFISSIIYTYNLKGALYAFLAIFPHQLLNAFLILICSSICLKYSFKLISSTYKGESLNLKKFFLKISVLFCINIGFVIIISLLEVFINPLFIKLVF